MPQPEYSHASNQPTIRHQAVQLSEPDLTQPVQKHGQAAQTQPHQKAPSPPTAQATQRVRAIPSAAALQIPHPQAASQPPTPAILLAAPIQRRARAKTRRGWLMAFAVMIIGVVVFTCGGLALGALAIYGDGVLPNVRVGDVVLGGMSQAQAAETLRTRWQTVRLIDPATNAEWLVQTADVGITLDADATVARAYQQGRGTGSPLIALFGAQVEPVLTITPNLARAGLQNLTAQLNTPAINARVQLVNGVVQAMPAHTGRSLDLDATLRPLEQNAADLLKDGMWEVVMVDVLPTVSDSSAMVEAASMLLTRPLTIRLYDPLNGHLVNWEVAPEQWAAWLTSEPNPASLTGLTLSVEASKVRDLLQNTIAPSLDASRYLKFDQAIDLVQSAIHQNQTQATVRVYHQPRQHTVQAGETFMTIAWDYGVPYLYVQQANPGITTLAVGQKITIPSVDDFLPIEPNPNKRIVVSISQQRVWVYENGAVKWEWVASTGIASSPTWTGVYQIISHVPNAYAANWNLYMPNFMGIYKPIPGADFTNGFHGFPTRGGGQLLWANSLGTKVTYGCILLSNQNAQTLYDWAEDGVVVEIRA